MIEYKYQVNNRKGRGNVGCLVMAAAGIVLLGAATFGVTSCAGGIYEGYSSGQRAGTLIKFSHKGLIWKSWEGQVLLNEFQMQGNGVNGNNVWNFSVTDPTVAKQLESLMGTTKKISFGYNQWFHGPIYQCTDYTVTGIKIME